jgi:hypothetical protein
VVYWCNSYTIAHFSLDIIEWFKYKLKKVFKLYLILIHPPLSINKLDIHGFIDVDWAGDLDHRRSTSGYVFNLFRGEISWMSKIQVVVALSTTKDEYMAATHACK